MRDTGAHTRRMIARERAKQEAADREAEEFAAHHAKWGDKEFGGLGCDCWGCRKGVSRIGSERDTGNPFAGGEY